jgi:hypothetical protein
LNNLDLKSTIHFKEIPVAGLDKDEWQHIWRVYNLLQEYCDVKFYSAGAEHDISESQTSEDEEIFNYFDPELHSIVALLIQNDVPFSHEGSYFLENEKGLIAEAAIGFSNVRIVIRPLSDLDREAFENTDYTVVEPGDFNLKLIGL